MKNFRKTLAFILAAVMLVSAFSGCGKKEPEKELPEYIYVPTYTKLELPEGIDWVGNTKFIDGTFYMIADSNTEVERTDEITGETYTDYLYVQKAIAVSPDGKNVEELGVFGANNTYSEEMEVSEYIHQIITTPEGPAVLVNKTIRTFDLPENFNPETMDRWAYQKYTTEYVLYTIGADGKFGEGKTIFSVDESNENGFYPSAILGAKNGNWYMASYQEVKVFDKDLNELYKIENINGNNGIIQLKDGRVGMFCWGETSLELKVFDDSKKAFGETFMMPENVYSFSDGNGIYDFICSTSSGSGICGYDVETGELTKILDWLDSDVDASSVYSERVSIIDEENIIAFEETWNDEGAEYNIITLKKTPYSEVPERKIITLACIYMDYNIRQEILEFNRTNTEYRIMATDYSEYASGEDYLGLTKLNTEIISGNIPDIFITNNMPVGRLSGKGIFEDLAPYVERDIGWDNLVKPFFDALMTEEGKLYEIYSSFTVQSYVGLKNVVGDGTSWTFDDLKSAFEKLPEGATVFGDGFNKEAAFSTLFSNNIESFVDWESGKCSFDSEEFIDILEFTENFPLEFEMDEDYYMYYQDPIIKVATGKQLLSYAYLYNFGEFRSRTFYILGENASFVGQPSREGNGNAFVLDSGFAMSASCEYKEAVWEFISRILTEEYQEKSIYNFPTNKAVFDKMLEKEMTPEFDEFFDPEEYASMMMPTPEVSVDVELPEGTEVPEAPEAEENEFVLPEYTKGQINEKGWHEAPKTWGRVENNGQYYEYPVYAMTEYEKDILMDIISSTTRIQRYDESIMKIVNEEVVYFYNGERTAQQTAEYIQSRVNIYVNEQR